jgi:hypothetical protein
VKGLYFPAWFYVLDNIYLGTEVFLGVNYGKEYTMTEVYKHISEKKKVYTYSYTFNVIKFLAKNNYLVINKRGRNNYLSLTKSGIKLGECVHFLVQELEYKI